MSISSLLGGNDASDGGMEKEGMKMQGFSIKKLVQRGMPAVMSLLLLAGAALPVQAGRTGQIQVSYTCNNGKTAVQGAEFSIVCVADAELDDKGAAYTLRSAYEESGLNPQEPAFWSSKDTPQKLLAVQEKLGSSQSRQIPQTQETDAAGNAYYSGLSAGIYLVWQSGADKEDAYETSLPLIVAVPTLSGSTLSFREWNCRVCPKTTKKPEKTETTTIANKTVAKEASGEPEKESVQTGQKDRGEGTGDASGVLLSAALSIAAMAGLLLYVWRARRDNKRN